MLVGEGEQPAYRIDWHPGEIFVNLLNRRTQLKILHECFRLDARTLD
jgi:hypothetical protein